MISSVLAAIRQRPILFNGMTGGVLCAGSDAMAQRFEHSKQQESAQQQQQEDSDEGDEGPSRIIATLPQQQQQQPLIVPSSSWLLSSFDYRRVGCAGLIGMFFGGIIYPQAYAILDAIWIGSSFRIVLKKSIIEIATVGIFVNSLSMTSRGLFQGDKHHQHVLEHVVNELPTVTRNDAIVWLPYNMIAFSMVPAILRPTTTAVMEATWQTYISLRSHDYIDTTTTTSQ